MRRIFLYIFIALWSLSHAQEQTSEPIRPVTSAYMFEVGSAQLADTYLTPLVYNGTHCELRYLRAQAMKFSPERWIMQLSIDGRGDHTENPAQNATIVNAMVDASWCMMRRWQLPHDFTVGIGPGVTADLGVMYLGRNGNNPASAKAAINLDAWAYAMWKHKFGKLPVTLRYSASLPVTGAFFSPNYGQLYYQIYLGDTKHLAHGAWWGNHFAYDHMLSADLHFGATTLRVAYHGRILSTKVNHLVTHEYSHALAIGIVTEWISLAPGKKLPDSKIVSAY